jgi:hypothetical protein
MSHDGQKFYNFYRTQKPTGMLNTVYHSTRLWVRWIQYTPLKSTALKFHFSIIFPFKSFQDSQVHLYMDISSLPNAEFYPTHLTILD